MRKRVPFTLHEYLRGAELPDHGTNGKVGAIGSNFAQLHQSPLISFRPIPVESGLWVLFVHNQEIV